MERVRQSITLRQKKAGSECTKETAAEQWQSEQDLLAARGRRQMQHEARLMGTLYPTSSIMQERHEELLQTQQRQLEAQAAERQRTEQQADVFASHPAALPLPSRPWAGSTMAYKTDAEEKAARRAFEAELAEDNWRLIGERRQQRLQQRQAEAQAERTIAEKADFWNVRATPGSPSYPPLDQRWAAWPAATASLPQAAAAAGSSSRSNASAAAAAVRPPYALHSPSAGGSAAGAAGSLQATGSGSSRPSQAGKGQQPAAGFTRPTFPWEWREA